MHEESPNLSRLCSGIEQRVVATRPMSAPVQRSPPRPSPTRGQDAQLPGRLDDKIGSVRDQLRVESRSLSVVTSRLPSPQAANSATRALSRLPLSRRASGALPERLALIGRQPVAQADAPTHAMHAANSSRKIRAEQAAISRFIRQAADCAQTQIDGPQLLVVSIPDGSGMLLDDLRCSGIEQPFGKERRPQMGWQNA
jgi:hypothetical protein